MSRIPRVLVVYKKSALQIYVKERRDRHIGDLLKAGHRTVSNMKRVHQEQEAATSRVRDILRKLKIPHAVRYRADRFPTDGIDLVISVGGDGTLLEASHHVGNVPLLGVNSSPRTSVGYLTATHAREFESTMRRLVAGKLPLTRLARLQVLHNGDPVGPPILNDVLFCNTNPAATSRYRLRVDSREEAQKSSGIWVATATGSTAALRSAGGRVLPPRSRKIAYLVREPYHDPGRRLRILRGTVSPQEGLDVVSMMRESALYMDGSHLKVRLNWGDRIQITGHVSDLRLYGYSRPTT